MRCVILLLASLCIASTQMTFTDNWEKRAVLSNLFRGTQRNDETVNAACDWDVIAESIRELKQIYKRQSELKDLFVRCTRIEHSIITKG